MTDLEFNLLIDDNTIDEFKKDKWLKHINNCKHCFPIYFDIKKRIAKESFIKKHNQEFPDDVYEYNCQVLFKKEKKDISFHLIQNPENVIAEYDVLSFRGEREHNKRKSILFNHNAKFHLYFQGREVCVLSHQYIKLLIILIDGAIHYHSQCQKNQEILLPIGEIYNLKYDKNYFKFQLTLLE